MKYDYGVSFNCQVERDDVGGGGEGWTSIDYVGNCLDRILTKACEDDSSYKVSYDHEYVGKNVNVGGKVVAVIIEDYGDDDIGVVAVAFTEPCGPTVVE